jgi:DNA-binding response OmpR family regulator
MRSRILVVEDNMSTLHLLQEYLDDEGFDVALAMNAAEALKMVRNERFELTLLDINLPDYDGYEVAKLIRSQTSTPIIFISAFDDKEHKLQAFRVGADDYVTKPFDIEELVARMWAVMRRTSKMGMQIATNKHNGTFYHDSEARTVYYDGEPLELTAVQYEILRFLCDRKNALVSRDMLKQHLGSYAESASSIDFHVKNLRQKIEVDPKHPRYLKTVYGKGFRLEIDR